MSHDQECDVLSEFFDSGRGMLVNTIDEAQDFEVS